MLGGGCTEKLAPDRGGTEEMVGFVGCGVESAQG